MNGIRNDTRSGSSKRYWLLWLGLLVPLIALLVFPASYRVTRMASLALAFVVWFGLIGLVWRKRWLRLVLITVTLVVAGFLSLPSHAKLSTGELRTEYLAGLQKFEGVSYYWGGESSRGIDCSGLIRRGLIDSLLKQGIATLDPGLVRRAIGLWWNDCTAMALGDGHKGLTIPVKETPNLNAMEYGGLLPGDLAVTKSGAHILAYLGDNRWIQADPGAGKVIVVTAPSENEWFRVPLKIVRWTELQ